MNSCELSTSWQNRGVSLWPGEWMYTSRNLRSSRALDRACNKSRGLMQKRWENRQQIDKYANICTSVQCTSWKIVVYSKIHLYDDQLLEHTKQIVWCKYWTISTQCTYSAYGVHSSYSSAGNTPDHSHRLGSLDAEYRMTPQTQLQTAGHQPQDLEPQPGDNQTPNSLCQIKKYSLTVQNDYPFSLKFDKLKKFYQWTCCYEFIGGDQLYLSTVYISTTHTDKKLTQKLKQITGSAHKKPQWD